MWHCWHQLNTILNTTSLLTFPKKQHSPLLEAWMGMGFAAICQLAGCETVNRIWQAGLPATEVGTSLRCEVQKFAPLTAATHMI
jgi:hypothetical protein